GYIGTFKVGILRRVIYIVENLFSPDTMSLLSVVVGRFHGMVVSDRQGAILFIARGKTM
ncbi:MAG: hypothetical protein Q9192_007322, partial [Flavoplaca navasiana]